MLKPAAELKAKLATDELVIGLMATDQAWPLLVEICQSSGLDYLIIDREHGHFSDELVSHICQIGRLASFPVMMRTVSCEASVIRRAMDMGPCGLLLPCVESTDQIDQVQQAALMPPRGRRRPGGMGNYWINNYQYETWKSEFEEHFIVIPQIESLVGVNNAASLAAHPFVTALGLGPYDLSADLGCCWEPENEKYRSALERVKVAADGADKKVWAGTDAPALRAKGFTFLWIGTTTSILTGAIRQSIRDINAPVSSGELAKANDHPPA
ncbi:MAG: aldolase/citrate lyase family protein [Planctomycetaceae bacterium]|jgi:2-keto-3-deoxy-L-rhamnonate aldolase RhmA|nr:aldolase/citrate lyase family protein [Planctomycetaceae bacterium]